MALTFGDNISYQGKKPLDSRSIFKTIADMKTYSENYLPPLAMCQNEEDGKIYTYDVNNEVNELTGKWRVLTASGGSGSGEENVIESIKVNGVTQSVAADKSVDITVPSIEGLTKDADLATVAKSGSYEDLSNKPIIPSLDGYAKTSEIPTKISELENDSNYLSSIPEEYVTDTELEAKGYLTEHQDISGKVDKVEGKSLISDAEIARLATVDNYDDTDIKAEIAKKADATAIPSKVSVLENDSKYQTESDVTTTLTDYATKTYVGEQIANAEHLKREIVTVLPSDEEASDNIIYMLKVESATGNDKYQEYMKIDGTVQMVGDTSVDLTDYAKSVDVPTTVSELTDSADYAKKTDLHSHDNKTVLDGITSTKVSDWDTAKTHADSAHAPSNAQENVLETVKVNNQEITPDENKAVNIDLSDYAKTTDIPTTLPADGGNSDTVNNHTVKSDVPENAKFTDTIYDDTEVKGSIEELNSNLNNIFVKPIESWWVCGEDANNILDTGIGLTTENFTNVPDDGWGTLVSFVFSASYRIQIVHTWNHSKIYVRACYGENWTEWKEITTMDKVVDSITTDVKSVLYNINNADNVEVAIDITKSGYKPIAVSLYNSGKHLWFAQGMSFSDTVCNLSLRGSVPSSATNAECKVLVTYIKKY